MTRAVAFAETHWSMVLCAQARTTALARDALETLCRTYWYPLYGYVRRCGHDPATAQDLTQDFFARFLQKNCLEQVDRSKGRFRSFLLASIKNFLSNERVRKRAIKRGGRHAFVPLDDEAEHRFAGQAFQTSSPEKTFDRAWALTVLDNALRQLETEYRQAGKGPLFEALHGTLAGDGEVSGYTEMAARLHTSEAAVKMAVIRLRRRLGQLLRAHVAQTVASPAELDDEMRHLFAAVVS